MLEVPRQKSQTRGSPGAKGTLYCLSESLVRVRHGTRTRQITGFELGDLESRFGDERIDLAIEVTTAREALPKRCKAILPDDYARIRSEAMLYKDEPAGGF